MIKSADLRKLAAEIRETDAARKEEKRVKCAQIVSAATGLALLRRKLGGTHV